MQKGYSKYSIPVFCLLLAAGYLIISRGFSAETFLAYTPTHPVGTAAIVLGLYALKCVTFVFPLVVLEIAVGHLFPVWAALTLNLIGIFIILTTPYCIGRAVGMNAVQKLVQKHPRFSELIGRQQENEFFLCFFLRVISCLPGDIVTLYMGATHTSFWKNLIGGTLGILPGMILATVMGNNIRDPNSPVFWGSIVLTVLLSVLSVGLEYLYRRKRWQKNGMQ